MRIYIVEDDKLMGEHIAHMLRQHHTELFTNGVDAIHRIDKCLPDVIILDILLDGPSGFSLLSELQSYGDTARIPVVICSSAAADFDKNNLTDYGVACVLDKTTMHPEDIIEAVEYARAPH